MSDERIHELQNQIQNNSSRSSELKEQFAEFLVANIIIGETQQDILNLLPSIKEHIDTNTEVLRDLFTRQMLKHLPGTADHEWAKNKLKKLEVEPKCPNCGGRLEEAVENVFTGKMSGSMMCLGKCGKYHRKEPRETEPKFHYSTDDDFEDDFAKELSEPRENEEPKYRIYIVCRHCKSSNIKHHGHGNEHCWFCNECKKTCISPIEIKEPRENEMNFELQKRDKEWLEGFNKKFAVVKREDLQFLIKGYNFTTIERKMNYGRWERIKEEMLK